MEQLVADAQLALIEFLLNHRIGVPARFQLLRQTVGPHRTDANADGAGQRSNQNQDRLEGMARGWIGIQIGIHRTGWVDWARVGQGGKMLL